MPSGKRSCCSGSNAKTISAMVAQGMESEQLNEGIVKHVQSKPLAI
jgi:hypothetical protein